ncbi:MAG: carboxymuconolactone decarboxylase family protein, partial [Thermosynechococcaceae cyanobacterium]
MEFTIHTVETAPEASKQSLVHAQETFGFVPNLEGILAESPVALQSGMALWNLFEASSFSPIEQQVIYLTANYENGCSYCVAAHSGLAKMIGMPADHIEALRTGQPLSDQKLQALRLFTQRMIEARG